MKIGDLVMFMNAESNYAKWFFGRLAVVESVSNIASTLKPNKETVHCRVKWLKPVKYFDKYATVSDFHADILRSIMKEGDLVKRKPEWGDWVKYNPWMYTDKDLQTGIIISYVCPIDFQILWSDQTLTWEDRKNLEKIAHQQVKP